MKENFRHSVYKGFLETIRLFMLYIMNTNFCNLLKKTTFTQNNIKNPYL